MSAQGYSIRRNLRWHDNNILRVLEDAKEKQVRDIDKTIHMAQKLKEVLAQKVDVAQPVAPRVLTPSEDCELMKPIEPEVEDVLMKSTSKGATDRYFKLRYRKSPEAKFYFRAVTSWDYGWQQKSSLVPPRDVHRGRCRIIQESFYRKANMLPDSPHYKMPTNRNVLVGCSRM